MKKLKLLNLLAILLVSLLVLISCTDEEVASDTEEPGQEQEGQNQIDVIVTMFTQYDFARQVGGSHVNVSRLAPPGVDIHSFDPTPLDIVNINETDLFIYTGSDMEPWVGRILDSLDNADLTILNVSTNITMLPWYAGEDHEHYHDHEEEGEHHHDDHNGENDHEHYHDHNEECDHSHGHGHFHNYDPHIWTSPINAIVMVRNIEDKLIALMPEYADYFTQNANDLVAELEDLDHDFREMVRDANRRVIYHAGRFALHYLMNEYDIDFVSAPMESDPDTALVARMITEINEYDIPVIFHEELVNPQTANMIAVETGALVLLLHTVHNVSTDEIATGETYVSLMRHNLEVLGLALN